MSRVPPLFHTKHGRSTHHDNRNVDGLHSQPPTLPVTINLCIACVIKSIPPCSPPTMAFGIVSMPFSPRPPLRPCSVPPTHRDRQTSVHRKTRHTGAVACTVALGLLALMPLFGSLIPGLSARNYRPSTVATTHTVVVPPAAAGEGGAEQLSRSFLSSEELEMEVVADGGARCWTDGEGEPRCLPTVFFLGVSKCGEHAFCVGLSWCLFCARSNRGAMYFYGSGVLPAHVWNKRPETF